MKLVMSTMKLGRTSRSTRAMAIRFSRMFSTAPSGKVSACRQPTPSSFAASAASVARCSALPRVPASPCVRSSIAVRSPRAAIRNSVPPQVCSTSSRWAAIAKTSAAKSEATEAMAVIALVNGIVAVGHGVHVCHVVGSAGHGHILVVDRRAVLGRANVHLPALHRVNLVQASHPGNARRIADIGLQQNYLARGRVVHGQATVGLAVIEALALVALGHADPKSIVVRLQHAAHSARCSIAD